MKLRDTLSTFVLVTVMLVSSFGAALAQSDQGVQNNSTQPAVSASTPKMPIHAVRIQYNNYATSRSEVASVDANLTKAHINFVSLSAGRVEWTYFKWSDHPEYISGDVKSTGLDFLALDSAKYKTHGWIDTTLDILSPNYIKAHPSAAAINSSGGKSTDIVGTMELVNGNYGKLLLAAVTYIAKNYSNVNSISITELCYHIDGYGPAEKTSYMAATGKKDWPRNSSGGININDASIGTWRSGLIAGYMAKLAAAAHAYGKKLFLDVDINRSNLSEETNTDGTDYTKMLKSVDMLIIWAYYYLDGYAPEYLTTLAQYLTKFGNSKIIMSIGLWGPNNVNNMPTDLLQRGLTASVKGGISNIWITPSIYMSSSLWSVLANNW
ncbi:MAG: hypothetical protein ABSE06_05340 [Anaerolineaceae bacterium]|jgi:hypothetical protein